MITIENTVLPSTEWWTAVIRGMRNPMNSWDRSDSGMGCVDRMTWTGEEHGTKLCRNCDASYESRCHCDSVKGEPGFIVGEDDLTLMKKLVAFGSDHGKFMRMIPVCADITAPLYWWKEYDTYKVGTVASSCSTMHKIAAKEFTVDDFSHDHLLDEECFIRKQNYIDTSIDCLAATIRILNYYRDKYLETKDKKYWWQMIQLLPSSYNQRRTVTLNYEVLRNICRKGRRLDHRLDEWRTFCDWALTLPYFKSLIGDRI